MGVHHSHSCLTVMGMTALELKNESKKFMALIL